MIDTRAAADAELLSVDPATEVILARFAAHTPEQVEATLAAADSAQREWRGRNVQRARTGVAAPRRAPAPTAR